ncbi:MAG: nucleoside triphosphate pyrophosphatase [Arenibacterium sp.]
MSDRLILASGSEIRASLLRQARLDFDVVPAKVDEDAIRDALIAEDAKPRDIADALAEMKARKIGMKHPDAMVIGCDQVLDFQGKLLSKPESKADAVQQLTAMQGHRHSLFSAAVICKNGTPVWRHVGQVRLMMRALSDPFITDYVERNWDSIRHAVGAYKLEEEGVRLFSLVDGDHFNVLGLPFIELLNFLAVRGVIKT